MLTKSEQQVLVVGGGPAGSAIAIVLKQAGINVLLVDASTSAEQQAPKVGESLPGAALRLLQRLGITGLEALLDEQDYSPCLANASAWGTPHWSYRDALVNPEGGGWHLLRQRFDQALLDHAIAQGVCYRNTKLRSISLTNQDKINYRAHLKTANGAEDIVDSDWVIDATGRKGLVARQLGGHYQRIRAQYAVAGWLKSDPADHEQMSRVKTVADGWWYTAHLPNQQRVAVFHGDAEPVARLARASDTFITAYQDAELLPFMTARPDLTHKLQACDAGIKRLEKAGSAQWLAVGDAAVSFDPLSAQGIFFALYSGIIAGELIAKQLSNEQKSAGSLNNLYSIYQDKVDRVFKTSLLDLQQLSAFS